MNGVHFGSLYRIPDGLREKIYRRPAGNEDPQAHNRIVKEGMDALYALARQADTANGREEPGDERTIILYGYLATGKTVETLRKLQEDTLSLWKRLGYRKGKKDDSKAMAAAYTALTALGEPVLSLEA